MQRGASMTTSEHIDPSIAPANLADMEDSDEGDIPEGGVRFDITAEQIAAAIAAESLEVRASDCLITVRHSSQACWDVLVAATVLWSLVPQADSHQYKYSISDTG